MTSWCWFGAVNDPPEGTFASALAVDAADGEPLPLAAWSSSRRQRPGAARADRRIVGPGGPAMAVSLALAPPGERVAFDDPAVVRALQSVLEQPWPAFVSTLARDQAHLAGAVTGIEADRAEAWPGWWSLDPFARILPTRRLLVPTGFLRRVDPPCGPVHQRYGGAPWPVADFG